MTQALLLEWGGAGGYCAPVTILSLTLRAQGLHMQAATHQPLPWVLILIKALTHVRPVLLAIGPSLQGQELLFLRNKYLS